MGCFLYCQCHILGMVLHKSSHIGAHAMSQTWSYGGPLILVTTPCPRHGLTWDLSSRCQRHILDMVLHETSHLGAYAMSQTWSYMGPLISVPTPCPRHGLTWDLS
ncbi:hypothetical protein Gotur_002373 [Gossypium turneri]